MEKLRRTLLYIPGNNPAMIQSAGFLGADFVVFDLEDAIPINQKDSARILVKNALKSIDFNSVETMVRINSWGSGFTKKDLDNIIPSEPDIILLPKAESKEDIEKVVRCIELEEKKYNKKIPIDIFALIETPLGVINSLEIACADKRMTGLQFGAEDFTANIGTKRTKSGEELFYSRSQIILACKAKGISAIDTPFVDIDDMEGLGKETEFAKQLGFDGKAVISPLHIDVVNEIFSPDEREISWAKKVLNAFEKGEKEGKGAVSVDRKMVDAPIAARARRIIEIAKRMAT